MRSTTKLSFESLEPRLAMAAGVTAVFADGVLSISATDGDEQVTIERLGNQVHVVQTDEWFAAKTVRHIDIELGDGDDSVILKTAKGTRRSFKEAVTITAGDGNDKLTGPDGKSLYFGGEDGVISVKKNGAVRVDGARPDWFNQNVSDTSLRERARAAAVDRVFSREDMLDLFANVSSDPEIGHDNLESLQAIVSHNRFFAGLQYVQTLSSYIVDGCVANAEYQGASLGNLASDSTGAHLQTLVDKWFLGLDHPNPDKEGYSGTVTYASAAGNLFDGTPTYVQVDQGEDGDCYFLSTMTSIITKNPEKIVDMFIVNGDGTWTVRYFNDSTPYYVTIDDMLPVDSDGEFIYTNFGELYSNPENVLWPAFAEKAYAQFAEFGLLDTGGPKTNSYAAINEGYANLAMQNVLGKNVAPLEEIASSSFKGLRLSFRHHRPVVLTTLEDPASDHIVSDHVYAMVGYDAATKTFELFNPWGIINNESDKPGFNRLTFEEIVQNFGYWGRGPVL